MHIGYEDFSLSLSVSDTLDEWHLHTLYLHCTEVFLDQVIPPKKAIYQVSHLMYLNIAILSILFLPRLFCHETLEMLLSKTVQHKKMRIEKRLMKWSTPVRLNLFAGGCSSS